MKNLTDNNSVCTAFQPQPGYVCFLSIFLRCCLSGNMFWAQAGFVFEEHDSYSIIPPFPSAASILTVMKTHMEKYIVTL
jgi:hypothetical protein